MFLPFHRWSHVGRHPLHTGGKTAQPCTLGIQGSSTCSCAYACVIDGHSKENHTHYEALGSHTTIICPHYLIIKVLAPSLTLHLSSSSLQYCIADREDIFSPPHSTRGALGMKYTATVDGVNKSYS